jgi:hypothetical protein
VLQFSGAKWLTLSVGLTRVTGASPMRLATVVAAGRVTVRVSGDGKKATYALTVTYAK